MRDLRRHSSKRHLHFAFIGTEEFHSQGGELRCEEKGSDS
jgi:hypothetical protein